MSSSIHATPNEALIGRRIAMNVAPLGLDPLEVLPRIEHLRALLGSLTLPSAAARYTPGVRPRPCSSTVSASSQATT